MINWQIANQKIKIEELIKNQNIEIERLKEEVEYLDKFSDDVVNQDDIDKRRNFVEYLMTISISEQSRNRWQTYLGIVDKQIKQIKEKEEFISQKEKRANELQNKITQLTNKLKQVKSEQEKNSVQAELDKAKSELQSIKNEILANEGEKQILIDNASLKPASTENWAIVFGGDIDYLSAQDEINKAKNKGFTDAQVYFNRNSYRSVIPFDDRLSVNKALPQVKGLSSYSKGAYIIDLNTWCPSAIPIKDQNRVKYWQCR